MKRPNRPRKTSTLLARLMKQAAVEHPNPAVLLASKAAAPTTDYPPGDWDQTWQRNRERYLRSRLRPRPVQQDPEVKTFRLGLIEQLAHGIRSGTLKRSYGLRPWMFVQSPSHVTYRDELVERDVTAELQVYVNRLRAEAWLQGMLDGREMPTSILCRSVLTPRERMLLEAEHPTSSSMLGCPIPSSIVSASSPSEPRARSRTRAAPKPRKRTTTTSASSGGTSRAKSRPLRTTSRRSKG